MNEAVVAATSVASVASSLITSMSISQVPMPLPPGSLNWGTWKISAAQKRISSIRSCQSPARFSKTMNRLRLWKMGKVLWIPHLCQAGQSPPLQPTCGLVRSQSLLLTRKATNQACLLAWKRQFLPLKSRCHHLGRIWIKVLINRFLCWRRRLSMKKFMKLFQ